MRSQEVLEAAVLVFLFGHFLPERDRGTDVLVQLVGQICPIIVCLQLILLIESSCQHPLDLKGYASALFAEDLVGKDHFLDGFFDMAHFGMAYLMPYNGI